MAEDVACLQQAHQEQLSEQKEQFEAETETMKARLRGVQGRLAVLGPDVAELMHDYRSLKSQCQQMPKFIADTSKSVMREVRVENGLHSCVICGTATERSLHITSDSLHCISWSTLSLCNLI